MATNPRTSNLGLDLAGRWAAVAGGTHGMGEAVALRFAQAGASVIIVGRSEEAAKRIIDECKLSQRPGAAYHFVKADLTLVAGVKEAVRSINKHAPNGIDYLVETQGGPPITKHALTSEGHEAHFALQNLSRFGIPYLLLREGKLKESLTIIAAAGQGGKTMDLDDIELQKDGQFTILKRASRDSNLVDGFVQEFARQYPKIGFNHIFPGVVATEQRILPFGLNRVYNSLVLPIIPYTVGWSKEHWGDGAVYLAANPSARLPQGQAGLYGSTLKQVPASGFAQDPANCKTIFEKLAAMIGA